MVEAILADQDYTENLIADINAATSNTDSRNSILKGFLKVTGSEVDILHSDWNK
ncbi:Histone-lysine N-methyltransferase ATX5 [Sesbania bispinosa]|nr:Histone-lysine N-methyltransferase ATX5 [Sesbania bispinosa]